MKFKNNGPFWGGLFSGLGLGTVGAGVTAWLATRSGNDLTNKVTELLNTVLNSEYSFTGSKLELTDEGFSASMRLNLTQELKDQLYNFTTIAGKMSEGSVAVSGVQITLLAIAVVLGVSGLAYLHQHFNQPTAIELDDKAEPLRQGPGMV